MPETGCRTRFLRIQYHAGRRDATALRDESGPGTAFRGGFRGGIRFGGQDSCGRGATDKPPHAIKMHPTPLLYASQSTATNIITFETTPSRYTENKVLFSVPCVCARETLFEGAVLGVPGAAACVAGNHQTGPTVPPNGSSQCCSQDRAQHASRSKLPSRYTENKVLFSVPCVYVREKLFWGFRVPFEAFPDEHQRTRRQEPAPPSHASRSAAKNGSHGAAIVTACRMSAGFLRRATPEGCFFSGFFIEKTAFFLEKMEKNGILFQFGFLKQASTQTTEISLWRSGKTSRKS